MRRIHAAIPALALWLVTGLPVVGAAELPVTQVTLYKHGVALFEREGTVPAGEDVRLDFQNNDMNDLLKSLIVTDSTGNVKGIRYDANETLDQRLSKFPFHIGENQLLSAFLDTLKGSQIELVANSKPVRGSIVGARALDSAKGFLREQISLLTDAGDLANFELSDVSVIRLLDPHQQQELQAYLRTLAESAARDRRSVFIEDDKRDARRLHASYIAPAAIWKSSYRLTLDGPEPMLEGWAIVDNTTNEDWNNVRLAVVSGRPISFISPLDTARYGHRDIAELPEDRAANPVVYGGSVDVEAYNGAVGGVIGGVASGSGNGYGPGSGGGQGGGVLRQFTANKLIAPPPPPAPATMVPRMGADGQVSTVQGATGATMGELFEYSFPDRITVKKNQSAMLPFLQGKIQARKLLIYTDNDNEHPVNAAELTNTSGKTLDGGPATVYDGGAYGGEALFETLKPGDKRLLGYAVDYGTRVTSEFGSVNQRVREVHAENGTLTVRYAMRQVRTYTIRNVDAKAKTLIVQQSAAGQDIISPKPLERTADAYRFEVSLPANGGQTLKVESESANYSNIALTDTTPDSLLIFVENETLSSKARTQLKSIADHKRALAGIQGDLQDVQKQLAELGADESRIRDNMESLNRVSGEQDKVHAYAQQLSLLEDQIAALRARQKSLTVQQNKLQADLNDEIRNISF